MRNLVRHLVLISCLGAIFVAPSVRASDSGGSTDSPDLVHARGEIKAKQYAAALADLKVMVVKSPTADVYSLLGHALWKTGDSAQGMIYYNKALALDPSHKGALEYQGELFVELKQFDNARANLARLNHLCWFGCEEASDLKEAIEHAGQAPPVPPGGFSPRGVFSGAHRALDASRRHRHSAGET